MEYGFVKWFETKTYGELRAHVCDVDKTLTENDNNRVRQGALFALMILP